MMTPPPPPSADPALFRGMTVSHYSYAVADIAEAVRQWTTLLGAGPFFVMNPVVFDRVSTRGGKDAAWEHSAAFGKWGPIFIELEQLHDVQPPQLRELLSPNVLPVVNHVAYISETPDEDSARLSAAGYDMFIHAVSGPVELWLHDTRDALGHVTEIHRASADVDAIWNFISAAASDWDGSEPLRFISSPGE